jgi:BclB C-terminal domain-containing protein
LTSLLGNVAGIGGVLGLSNAAPTVSLLNSFITLDLTTGPAVLPGLALSNPYGSTIIDTIALFFTVIAAVQTTPSTIRAQIWTSPTPNNSFTAIGPITSLTPAVPGVITVGSVHHMLASGLNLPLTAETRIVIVFSITNALVASVTGYPSASIGFLV